MDCDTFVTNWYGVDDGSSAAEMATMKGVAPQIKWLQKPQDQSGHVGSINTLFEVAADYDYFVWMEDDWFFIRDEQLITKAVSVMQGNPSIAQVRTHSAQHSAGSSSAFHHMFRCAMCILPNCVQLLIISCCGCG